MKLLSPIPWIFGRVLHGVESSIRVVGWTRNGSSPRPDISLIAGLVAPLLLWSAGVGVAQTVDTTLWVTNGPVASIVPDGNTIYIGGFFTQVGPATGGAIAIDASTGAAQQPRAEGRRALIRKPGCSAAKESKLQIKWTIRPVVATAERRAER